MGRGESLYGEMGGCLKREKGAGREGVGVYGVEGEAQEPPSLPSKDN